MDNGNAYLLTSGASENIRHFQSPKIHSSPAHVHGLTHPRTNEAMTPLPILHLPLLSNRLLPLCRWLDVRRRSHGPPPLDR